MSTEQPLMSVKQFDSDDLLVNRTLYDLCQMFPKAAANNIKFILQDASHDMEKIQEVKGRALFPGLDMVSFILLTYYISVRLF